jgi:peroxiredoxin
MTNSLADILMSKNFDEPAEATAIKKFVMEKWDKSVAVTVRDKDILIAAQGASFANALRMQSRQMQRAANTTKRLVIRIA